MIQRAVNSYKRHLIAYLQVIRPRVFALVYMQAIILKLLT